MYPNADEMFDFKRGITFLDKELEQLFPPKKNKFSMRIVDKLAKVYTRDGKEKWILVHCEVQGKYDSSVPRRMFTYFIRIYDKYGVSVSAHLILTEPYQVARPNSYIVEFPGTKMEYKYNVYKITQQSDDELLKSDNPFAMAVLITRSVLKHKELDDAALMEIKIKLYRQLLEKSFSKDKIRKLIIFLDSYISFADSENDCIFDNKIKEITGRTETMGIEEMVLAEREERGQERGMRLGKEFGIRLGEERGIRLGEERGMRLGEERGIRLGQEYGMRLGEERGKTEIITHMLQKNLTDDTIADFANVSIDYVQRIRASLK